MADEKERLPHNRHYVVENYEWFFERKDFMKKEFLHIFSFVMIAIFTFSCIGAVSAEETFDIPVIEEVSEEELAEVLPEEADVEMMEEETEIAKEEAYFEIRDGKGNHVWFFADLKEALSSDKLQNGYTLLMLKDYTWDYTLADVSKGEISGIDMPGSKTFTWDGDGHTITDKFDRSKYTRMTQKDGVWTTELGGHDDRASYNLGSAKVTAKNITFSGNPQNTINKQGHTNGCFNIGNGQLTLKDVKFINYFGWNGSVCWMQGTGKLVMVENVTAENCSVQYHGLIGINKGTAEISGFTMKNCKGTAAIGVGTVASEASLNIENSTITNCSTGILVGASGESGNQGVANIGDNVTISGCSYGISVHTGATVNVTGLNVNINRNTESGIVLYNKKEAEIGSTLNATGGMNITENQNAGIDIAENSIVILNGNVNVTENTNADIRMEVADALEVGEGFTGTAGVSVVSNDIWFGHLAEGVETLNGTIYEGIDPNGHKGAVYESLIGSGTVTHNGKTYSLKKPVTRDLDDNALVIGYKMYKKTGSDAAGYKRVGADAAIGTSMLSGGEIYLLSDITLAGDIKCDKDSSTIDDHFDFTGSTAVANIYGNGHTISIHDDYTKGHFFAVYQDATMNFHDVIYNGKGRTTFAYIHCSEDPKGGGAISADNVIYYNGKHTTYAGGIYNSGEAYAGTINVKDCKFIACKGANGGALYSTGLGVLNVSDTDFIDCAATSNGGAVYLTNNHTMTMSGEINATGNKRGSKENNVYLSSGAKINIAGNITGEIGLTMAQSGATFGTVADTNITGLDCFYADGAEIRYYTAIGTEPVIEKVKGTLFPETVGTGELNGEVVIDMQDVASRKEGREKDAVLHWPWIVVKEDETRYGYVSLNSAYSNLAATSFIYAQKDITIQHLWDKAITTETTSEERKEIYAHVEFPLPGSGDRLNHINTGANVNIDGNGHVITVDKSDSNYMFVIYGNNKSLQLKNFIYNADKPMAHIHKDQANGTEAIIINNSYFNSPNRNVIGAFKGGTVTVNDSTVIGTFDIGSGAKLILSDTAVSKPSGKSVVLTGVAPVEASGETAAVPAVITKVTVKGDTTISAGNGLYANNKYVEVIIDESFTGSIEVNEANGCIDNVKAGEGFTSLESVKSITKAGSNGETFAYYDEANEKFAWTMAPELTRTTDSGKYSDGYGTIRFLTTFKTVDSAAVASYGTYAVGESSFVENAEWEETEFIKFDKTPEADKVYYVDVIKIPAEHFDTKIKALSFVKIKGIKTPIYYDFNLASVNKNDTETGEGTLKNLGKPTYAEAEA